jgi:replication factor A1
LEQSAAEIVEKIANSSGMGRGEVEGLVGEKLQRFSGLLTDSGAALMVAKELGVDLQLSRQLQYVAIKDLQDGMQNIDVLARVVNVLSPKSFERNGRKGTLCTMIIADKSGETRLTLWHNDVKKMLESGVERGGAVLLQNCYVKSFNGRPQLNLSYNGGISVNPKEAAGADLPPVENREMRLSELSEGMNDISAVVRVLRVFPANEFEKEGGKGKVVNFLVGDDSAVIRATAWNNIADLASELPENCLIKVEGAYTKQGLRGIELHLGWKARILANPKTSANIPGAMQLLHEKTESKKISELAAGGGAVLVKAKVAAVNAGMLRYNVCPECGAKVQKLEGGLVCEKCGEVKEADIRPVISARIEDESGSISLVAYGSTAEQLIGMRKEELRTALENAAPEEIIKQIQARIAGKEISAVGSARQNLFSNELEFTARSVEI